MLRVAWVYFKLAVCIMVFIHLALLSTAMLNQVSSFRASRFEIGSTSQVRNSTEIPATQTPRPEIGSSLRRPNSAATQPDLATVLNDREVHARSRVGLEQIESLPPVIEEQLCTICQFLTSPPAHIQTLACGHEFHSECIAKWLSMKSNCPNCWADTDRANLDE